MAPPSTVATASDEGAGAAMRRISTCLAELQGALGVVEQYTEGGAGPQGITPHEKFAATKLVYHALCRLTALLDGACKEELLPLEGPLVQATTAVLQAKKLSLTPPFRRALTACFALLLQRSTTLGIFTLAKDMQAILLTPSKAGLPPLARVAAMEIVTRALQIKARQLSPGLASEVQAAIFKNWKSATTPSSTLCGQCSPADLVTLKCAALRALAATMGVTGKLETFKAIKMAASDKAPEVRREAALALVAVLRPERAEDDFRAVSLDAYLTLGLKGVADDAPTAAAVASGPCPNVQLQWAEALAHILAVSVAGQATRAKARSIRAARGGAEAEQESELPSSKASSSSSSSSSSSKKGRPPEIAVGGDDALGGSGSAGAGLPPAVPGPGTPGKKGLATMSAKIKSLTAAAALAARGSRPNSPAPGQAPADSGASSSGGSAAGSVAASSAAAAAPFFLHTFESAVQYLIALFLKANSSTTSSSNSSSAAAMPFASTSSSSAAAAASSSSGALGSGPLNRAGIAAALVAFLRRHRGHLAREDTLQWLLGVLLSAVARPGRAQAALKEDMGARAGVAHVLQAGLSMGAPEQVQLSVAAALGRLLLESAAPPSSLSPLQLQLALGQLTLLLPTLGEGAGPALLSLRSASLLPSSSSSSSSPADTAHSLPHLPRRLLALCRHGSYGVRVEAAVALASLVRALPYTGSGALAATASAVRLEYEALELLMVDARAGDDDDEAPSSSSSSSDEEDDEEEEEGEGEDEGQEGGDNVTKGGSGGTSSGIRAPSPTPDGAGATGTAATTAIAAKGGGRRARRARGKKGRGGVEAERRRRVCALHGCGAALVLLLKGASGTGSAVVPAALLEDVMATAKQLVNQAFGPQAQARRWATGVRTGWAIFGALLHQGADRNGGGNIKAATTVGGVSLRPFFHLMARCIELERQYHHAPPRRHHHHHHLASIGSERDLPLSAAAAAAAAAAAGGVEGPSHLLEAMLGALLVLVRECPEALQRAPGGALKATVDLLDSALQHLRLPMPTQQQQQQQQQQQPRSVSPPPGNGEGSGLGHGGPVGTRTALIHATVMEAYALLPAGAYPQASAARLFDWALGQLLGLLSPLAEGAEGREVVVESSLLSDFLHDREDEDAPPLESRSIPRSSFFPSGASSSPMTALDESLAGGPAREDLLALWVQTRGVALEDREREAAIATGAMGSPAEPPPRHASGGARPPPPHPSARVRLLDASTCLLAATFPLQGPERRADAIGRLLALLPPQLRAIEYLSPASSAAASEANRNGAGGATGAAGGAAASSSSSASSSLSSILPSAAAAAAVEEGRRRRREAMQGALARNVATVLLALVKVSSNSSSTDSQTDGGDAAEAASAVTPAVPWVMRLRDGLFGLLGAPAPGTRRAACEGLVLLAQHTMLSSSSSNSSNGNGNGLLEHTVSCLVEVAMRGAADAAAAAGSGAGGGNGGLSAGSAAAAGLALLMPKSAAATAAAAAAGAAADLQACRAAGAAVALAALRRALWPAHVRLQPCWAAVQCLMVADTAQPLRTWALHALGLLVKGMSLGAAAGRGHTQDALQTLDTILEIMEAHFLAPWATPTLSSQSHASSHSQASASDNEVGLLVALARLFTALLPAVLELELSREKAGGGDDGGRLLKKFKATWRVLAAHPDDRVALECCRALELLALFRPHDPWLAAPQTVGLVRLVLQGGHAHRRLAAAIDPFLPSDVVTTPTSVSAHLLSPAACAAALSCVRALAKRHAPALRRQRMEATLLAAFDATASAQGTDVALCSASLPQWRAVANLPRALLACRVAAAAAASASAPFPALLEDLRATLDVLMGGEGGRPTHCLLLARAIVLGTPAAVAAAATTATTAALMEEEEGEGEGAASSLMAAGGEGDMAMEAAVAERLRAKAAEAARGLPAARWQTKAVVLDAAVAALATLERELQGLLPSQALLYVEARRLIRAFYHSQGQGQQQQPLAPSPRPSPTPALSLGALEASPLLLAPLLPDILALGCHAAAAAGAQGGQQQAPSALSSQAEEEGEGHGASAVVASAEAVPELQLKGVQVLGTLVRLFAGVPDPDAPPEEQEEQEAGGRPPSVLAQYTSQVTAALAPVLANPLSPALVEAGCGLFFAGLRAGLLDDAIVLKRLLGRLLPSPLPSSSAPLLAPCQDPSGGGGEVDGGAGGDGMTVTTLCIRAVRRQAIAAAFVLAMREGEQGDGCGSGSSSPSTMSTAARGMLRRFFLAADGGGSKTKAPRQRAAVARSLAQQLLPDWLGGLADALRFVQGQGLWPALGASSSTRGGSLRGGGGGCTYGGGVDAQRLAPHYIKGWPVLLAAASLALTSTASAAATTAAEDDEGEQQQQHQQQHQQHQQRRAFAFLLATSEAALQQEAAATTTTTMTTTTTASPNACASNGVDSSLPLPALACVLEAVGALLMSPLAVAAMDGGGVDAEEDAEVVAAAAAATAAFRLTPVRLGTLLRAVATLAAAAAQQGGQQAAAVRVLQRLLGEGGSIVPRMLQQEGTEAGAGALWDAVEEAALLPLARHLPALFPSSSGQEPNAPAAATSAVLFPSLLVAVSLPAALPRLCPAAQRAEALPRLLSLGLRALTLGVEGNNSSSITPGLDFALVDAGMALLRAVGGQFETATALAAVLGEALVVVVTKGLAALAATGTDAGRGWEGWLAALPPPGAAAEVEAAIDAGLAWVAASASASDTGSETSDGPLFAPALGTPLGTRARRVLLAGARAAVQTRGPRASQVLRHFGPAAVQALSSAAADPVAPALTPAPAPAAVAEHEQPPASTSAGVDGDDDDDDDWGFDDAPPLSTTAAPKEEEEDEEEEHLLAEATKLLLLGFTSLSLSPSFAADLPTLQARHLALSLPLLSRLLHRRYSPSRSPSSTEDAVAAAAAAAVALGPARTATRQLLAQALLAVARAAPGPFKDGVQRLPPQDRAALEGALRAAVAGAGSTAPGGGGGGGGGGAAAPSAVPLKIDMSRYTT